MGHVRRHSEQPWFGALKPSHVLLLQVRQNHLERLQHWNANKLGADATKQQIASQVFDVRYCVHEILLW